MNLLFEYISGPHIYYLVLEKRNKLINFDKKIFSSKNLLSIITLNNFTFLRNQILFIYIF